MQRAVDAQNGHQPLCIICYTTNYFYLQGEKILKKLLQLFVVFCIIVIAQT
jgi:hypothetical protein